MVSIAPFPGLRAGNGRDFPTQAVLAWAVLGRPVGAESTRPRGIQQKMRDTLSPKGEG